MGKKKQNNFYTSIAKYYSEIFPYNPVQLNFVISEVSDLKNLKILDIGCATGELAFQLVNEGAEVVGIDLNEGLLNQAIKKTPKSNLNFQLGDMLKLEDDFLPGQFDVVLCFGNTLVHLLSENLIRKMLRGVFSILKPDGKFLLQILNYDYIIEDHLTELPVIETENIRFNRRYSFEDLPLIGFKTDLLVKNESKTISNENRILALQSTHLKLLLSEAGFSGIEFYSDFKKGSFCGKHLPLVVRCSK